MKAKILDLSKQDEILRETIKIGEQTIETLKKENEELKNELKKLHQDIDKLKNESMENKIKKLSKFYIMAIQDINSVIQLELKHKNTDFEKTLKKLRRYKNTQCHIIDKSDDINTNNEKIAYLYKKLQNLDPNVKNNINERYPYIIDNILTHLKTISSIDISDEIKTEIEEIMDDLCL